MKTVAIYNPQSGSYSRKKLDYCINFLSKKVNNEIIRVESKYSGFAMDYFRTERPEMLFIFGGDGFINEVIKALFGNDVKTYIYPLPFGTVNVFCREYKIGANFRDALERFDFKFFSDIYLGVFERNVFIQMLGVGFDAMAVKNVDLKIKHYAGRYSYFLAGLKSLASKYKSFRVSFNGLTFNPSHLLVSIGENYGGEFKIAKYKEGCFSVIMAEDKGFINMLKYLFHIFTFYKNKKIYYTGLLRISGVKEVQIDGEHCPVNDEELVIEIVKSKLKLVLPDINR